MITSYWRSQSFLRVLTFFVASHLGRMIAGSILLIIGAYNIVIYAPNSHQISYQQLPAGSYHLLLTMDTKYYVLQGKVSHDYYLIDLSKLLYMAGQQNCVNCV